MKDKNHITYLMTCCAGALALLGAGCITVGPDYIEPETDLPTDWGVTNTTQKNLVSLSTNTTFSSEQWWTTFNDPVLTNLIEIARLNNLDVKQAEARLKKARAQRDLTSGSKYPTVGLTGSASKSKGSEQTGSGDTSTRYSTGLDASWEIDIFGGRRREIESAEASLEATEDDLDDVLVSLVSEVALDYVDYRTYQKLIEVTETNIVLQEETYNIACWRNKAQLVTQLDVDQAKMSLETTRAGVSSLRSNLETTEHQLAILLGKTPGSLEELLHTQKIKIPSTDKQVFIGIPADILRQRPDIQQAERLLAAQTAQIGVAVANRYPDFSLSGSIGLESLTAGDLLTTAARMAQGAISAAWTVFDGGQLSQKVIMEEAYQEELLAAYIETILTALQEVKDALSSYSNETERFQALSEAMISGQSAFKLANYQYSSGVVDFENLLTTQKSLLNIQEAFVDSEAKQTTELIRLYKALGGGWQQNNNVNNNTGTTENE